MSHNGNWFAVSRLIFDHHIVGVRDRPYTELEAWLWLLAAASWERTEVINKGRPVVIDPGQMMHARTYLAQTWQWTEDKVRWFLKRLENEAMITRFCAQINTQRHTQDHTQRNTQQPINQIQIITVCNYKDYQVIRDIQQEAQHPPTPPPSHPASHPQVNTSTPKHKDSLPADAGRERGTRLPKDWALSVEWREAARTQFAIGEIEITTEANTFRDYWLSLAGAKAVKTDWFRTWLNWIRKNYPEKSASGGVPAIWWRDSAKVSSITPERWREAIRTHANGTWPVGKLGPPPGHASCVVPEKLITELRLTEVYDSRGLKRR